ncbi:MAG TPA: hypothetical protein DCY13_01395 [Verrucomicrobiales bacterium]|nr:hypothetical protein [Verrucomicrobiales bacterium]
MSTPANPFTRKLVAAGILLAVVIPAFLLFRPALDEPPAATAADYLSGLKPVVSRAEALGKRLTDAEPGSELFNEVASLEAAWAETRTAPGYDRQRHDDFIIVFGSFITRMKSAGLIWRRLNEEPAGTSEEESARRLELLFMLQSLHGAETAPQLLAKRGMELDQLLSRTNLSQEVSDGLAGAPAVLNDAVRLFRELEAGPPGP